MRPKDLSEFSYGYALTEALIHGVQSPLRASPYFPSMPGNGQDGDDDPPLSFSGELIYLRFKLADRMERGSAIETRKGFLKPPFFRMPLRASPKSDQHAMLLELEDSGARVFYVAPLFNTAKALDDAYLARGVVRESRFFRPSQVGPLPDDKAHWVSFMRDNPIAYFCSDRPHPLDTPAMLDGRAFLQHLRDIKPRKINAAALRRTAERMQEIILKELLYGPFRRVHPIEDFRGKSFQAVREELIKAKLLKRQLDAFDEVDEVERRFLRLQQEREPPEQVAYLARTFFGCEVIRVEKT